LLADAGHVVCEQYGVWGEKSMFGNKYFGVIRSTFLIDPQGNIAEIYDKVSVPKHSTKVLKALQGLHG
ncbi:MAG: redoxin domain-containing protein, partial [Anaerolineales bacterium]|nr:redoxin domain-containing protein [Anaerolineales bacterium]